MEKIYITANELIDMLGISRAKAYNRIKEMNSELKREGYIVIKGKVPRAYFEKRWYGMGA